MPYPTTPKSKDTCVFTPRMPYSSERFQQLIQALSVEFSILHQQLETVNQQNSELHLSNQATTGIVQMGSYIPPDAPALALDSFIPPDAPALEPAPRCLESTGDRAPSDELDDGNNNIVATMGKADSQKIAKVANGEPDLIEMHGDQDGPRLSDSLETAASSRGTASASKYPKDKRGYSMVSHKKVARTKEEKVLKVLDVAPAFVILANACTIGLSADVVPNSDVWKILEGVWIICYTAEFIIKFFLLGAREYFFGKDKRWNWFDFICLSLSLFDLVMTYVVSFLKPSGGLLGMMKMLRLARLARLLRALHFSIFDELKQMLLGVVSGVRVLIWAIVLLFAVIFFIGVMVNSLMGADEAELKSLPMAMFTVFRCYTDGCSANDGTPLSVRLLNKHGVLFFFGYILSFMFVTVGIFNLIMAIFIDNVVSRSVKRKLLEIGASTPQIELRIKETLAKLITEDDPKYQKLGRSASAISDTGKSCRVSIDLEAAFDEIATRDFAITRGTFTEWLEHPEMNWMLEDADVDVAAKAELFDVLDVDMGGELELEELINGLMKMRGPITKSDIVAVRLKVRYLVDLVEEVKSLVKSTKPEDADSNQGSRERSSSDFKSNDSFFPSQ